MASDFSSLDKLVEFGLGVGVATQMMNTMNQVIANTAMPGVGLNPGMASGTKSCSQQPLVATESYYIVKDDRMAGPLSQSELTRLVDNGVVTGNTLCWREGMDAWKFAKDIPDVNKLLLLKP